MLSLPEKRKNDTAKTDNLLKAIQRQPFDKIKELVTSKGIPIDASFSDYAALTFALEQGRKDVAQFLLDNRCRVNRISRHLIKPSSTPLHHAVKLGDINLVQKLLEKNASMTVVNSQNNSPLHLSFILKEHKITDLILDFILQTATYANPKNNHGLTHLHIAISRKNAALVLSYMKIESNLADTMNEDSPYYPGYSVAQFAVEFKCPLILKLLLERGGSSLAQTTLARVKQDLEDISIMSYLVSSYSRTESPSRISEFHISCMRGDPTLVGAFLDYGALVNHPVNENAAFCPLYTPLHYAAETNCKENVQILLHHGADVDFQNAYYMTALHVALYNDQLEIVQMLWEASRNKLTERTDRNGLSYFHVAVVVNDLDVVRQFLDKGQDVDARVFHNHRNFSGYAALHFAARYGHLAMAKLLIERKANVNISDLGQHGTPLHIAFSSGQRGLIDYLLRIGARVDLRRPKDGKTVLHLLVESYMDDGGRSKMLDYVGKFVFGCRLDVNVKDSDGYTALHYACTKISVGAACVKVLLDHGADVNIENKVGDTPFEVSFYDVYRGNAEDYALLYHHVRDLKTLGMWVNPKNEECCQRLLKEKNDCQEVADCLRTMQLTKRQQESENEVARMKGVLISKSGVTVHQFVLMDENQLREFGGKSRGMALKSLVEGRMIGRDFGYFGYRVKVQWHRMMRLKVNGDKEFLRVEKVVC